MAGNVITSYATLEQAIQDWLARTDLTDSNYLPEIIRAGEDRLYQGWMDNKGNYWPGLRIRAMETVLPGGGISAITITSGGTNYSSSDTIAFTAAPAGGVTATGTLTITNGVITAIVLTNPGLGYTSAPTGTITTSTGSGANITFTISSAAAISPSGNMAVPSDYLELKYMILTFGGGQTTRMERKAAEWIYQFYSNRSPSNLPQYAARDGGVFIFAPYPDSTYAVSGLYYQRPAYLSGTNATNWILSSNNINYGNLLLSACLAEAGAFIRDDDWTNLWNGRFMSQAMQIQFGEKQERWSGSPLSMTPG